jgi:hypothetical protein
MSFETISLTLLILSFLGLAVFAYKKIPALIALPQDSVAPAAKFFSEIKGRVGNIPLVKNFSPEVFLQKIISQVRILSLRADHKTANWLKTLRQKTQKKKLEDSSYWQEKKNSKNLKK